MTSDASTDASDLLLVLGEYSMGQTAVMLALAIDAFHQGKSPEEIQSDYPSLKLSQIYSAIARYLECEERPFFRKEAHERKERGS